MESLQIVKRRNVVGPNPREPEILLPVASGMSLKDSETSFLRSRRLGTTGARTCSRERTIYEYSYDLRRFFDWLKAKGVQNYNEIKRNDILEFIEHLQGLDCAAASKNKVLRTLRAFFRWVEKDEECQELDMKSWHHLLPQIPKNTGRTYIPTPELMSKFVNAIGTETRSDFRDKVVTTLMLDTGMRIGEICHLRPSHLKLDNNMLLVPAEGKTGERLVPFSPLTATLLKKWVRFRESFARSEYLFLNKFGGRCTPSTFDQAFERHRTRIGVGAGPEGTLTPHTVRHYFCTHYLVNGGKVHGLQAMTGHKSMDTLSIYVHLADQINFVQGEHAKFTPLNTIEGKKQTRKMVS